MKRTFAIGAVVLLFSFQSDAQIPNPGFETWSGGSPVNWLTNNVTGGTTVTQSNNSHSGLSSVRGDVISFFTTVLSPTLQSGSNGRGFAFTQRPASLTGYYQWFPASNSGDRMTVSVSFFKGGIGGTAVGAGAITISTAISSYTPFTTPINYLTADVPDTCVIQFQIVGSGTGVSPKVGSYYLIDDLAFAGGTAVLSIASSQPTGFRLNQNFPNPFNPSTNMSFTVAENGRAILRVFNLLGQEVTTLFDGKAEAGKAYTARFDASGLPSGIYFSRLDFVPEGSQSSSQQLMKKMTLIR
jgi:hypothetical protein